MVAVTDVADNHGSSRSIRAVGQPEQQAGESVPGTREVSGKGGLCAREKVLAVGTGQVEAARIGGGLQTPDIPAHLELVLPLDQADLLVEMVGDVELAA